MAKAIYISNEEPSPMPDGNEEFPVPFAHYARLLKGTPDEVWTLHLKVQHGRENHTLTEWRALHDTHRDKPAHWAR